ncbi:MAG: pantetheine-phosphate adenylyltransferase [Oscillospiraceae bacterium]|nr:pantetheine-phosphate adenylyltransferase [Oscillospiraceae bacterium]
MTTAIYPGSFDPPTLGHLDIIKRSSAIFDELIICVMHNGAKAGSLFTCKERAELLRSITAELPNVRIDMYGGLLADYVKGYDSPVVIRGLRAVTDFDCEFQMAAINKKLNPAIETMFMVASERYTFLSSSVVRELGRYRRELTCFVPKEVEAAVHQKFFRLPDGAEN